MIEDIKNKFKAYNQIIFVVNPNELSNGFVANLLNQTPPKPITYDGRLYYVSEVLQETYDEVKISLISMERTEHTFEFN